MSGVVEATEGAFAKHPALWGGVLLGVVAIVYLYSRSGSTSAASPTFTYSSGPSDAAVAAGAAIQVAQIQANQAASTTASNTASASSIASSYFGYLSNAAQVSASTQEAQIAATQNTAIQLATINTNASTSVANINANASAQMAADNVITANVNANAATQIAGLNLAATNSNNAYAYQGLVYNDNIAYAEQQS